MSLALSGTVVAQSRDDPDAFGTATVLIVDGLVASVRHGTAPPPAAVPALRLDPAEGWLFPGVIDLHNHLAYDTLPLWTEPSQVTPFAHHRDWTDEATYQRDISWPAWTLARCEPQALLAYVEAKALIGGTTAVQGSPGASRPRAGSGVRLIDDETFGGTDRNLVFTSTLTMTPEQLVRRSADLTAGRGLVYHCAEGRRGSVVAAEYDDARRAGLLQERLIAVHTNAVADYTAWRPAPGGVVWSPFSNLWLYGQTTDVPAALAAGLTVALGSDWSPSGTKHVLGEVKVASLWNDHEGWGLSDRQLVTMVTSGPGDLLARAWPHPAGRLVPGALGDVTVISRRSDDPWRDLITARETDVRLVVVGGSARYGTPELMAAAGAGPSGALTIAGARRRICIPDPSDPTRNWSMARIRSRLNAVRADPAAALERAERDRMQAIGSPAAGDDPRPLVLTLDMPAGGGPTAGPPPDIDAVRIPALDGLTHSPRWLAGIRGRGFHGGVLDGLASFYR